MNAEERRAAILGQFSKGVRCATVARALSVTLKTATADLVALGWHEVKPNARRGRNYVKRPVSQEFNAKVVAAARAKSNPSLQTLGIMFGRSRERIRQILKAAGFKKPNSTCARPSPRRDAQYEATQKRIADRRAALAARAARIIALRAEGKTLARIATIVGCEPMTVHRTLKAARDRADCRYTEGKKP
ncbi:MAG: helix-turn-helix domain-containing protein [Bacteroidia bacterium]